MSKKLDAMTREQRSILLYLEDCAVNKSGQVDDRCINAEEVAIVSKWKQKGFIEYGRIVIKDVNKSGASWVKLSDGAFKLAHEERKARALRIWENKSYKTTKEKDTPCTT